MRRDRPGEPAAEPESDDLDLVSTDVADSDEAPRARRRRGRRRRKADRAEESELEAGGELDTSSERDWNAVVTGSPAADEGWLEWSAENEPDAGPVEAESAPATAEAGNGSVEETVAVWETVAEPVGSPAAGTGERGAGDDVEGESPPRYRSTPSWPPPQRGRFLTRALCALILIVVVALLLTNGQIGRPDTADRRASVQNRPALRTDPGAVPAGWILYRHPSAGYGVSHPPGWDVRQEGSTVHIRDPQTGAELRVEHRKGKGTVEPEAVWTDMERSFTQRFPDYRRLQLSPASYLGHKAALWEFTHTEGDGRRLHSANLGFVTERARLSLYFQAPVAQWEELLPAFQGFLSSFRAPK